MVVSDTESTSALEGLRYSPSPAPNASKKRKRDVDLSTKKSVKPKKKKKPRAAEDDEWDLELGIHLAIGRMDSALVADYVAQQSKRFGSDLSLVELEDRHIPRRPSNLLNAVHVGLHFELSTNRLKWEQRKPF